MNLHNITPTEILVARYALESRLTAPASVSGHQEDLARLGVGGKPQDGGRINTAEIERARLADLLLLCRDLSQAEEKVCRARYGEVNGSEAYRCIRRLCDMREGDGEHVVSARAIGPDGKPLDGYVQVHGERGKRPDFGVIADSLGIKASLVRRLLTRARDKVEQARKWRAFMATQERD